MRLQDCAGDFEEPALDVREDGGEVLSLLVRRRKVRGRGNREGGRGRKREWVKYSRTRNRVWRIPGVSGKVTSQSFLGWDAAVAIAWAADDIDRVP